ncbi:M-protein, striated muscle [Nerophis ophidion]|uniref:M-protein, striated muscle n=1 Tax=Nerophis ophidion TaxID=159077 RepID=UPI002AE0AD26|nr:M-protein, striated muscle [Nerophis ophidion]
MDLTVTNSLVSQLGRFKVRQCLAFSVHLERTLCALDGATRLIVDPGQVRTPGEPTDLHASEIFKSYVVLSWDPPSPRGPAPLWYVVEKCVAGTGVWQRVNAAVRLHSPRCPVFDLHDGQEYQFRVCSVNVYGSSQASAPSGPIRKVDVDGEARHEHVSDSHVM